VIQLDGDAFGYMIHDLDRGRTILIQTDWDYPGVASSFGWDIRSAHAPGCADPSGTDGTIDCPSCGTTASSFITAAESWMDDHLGAIVEDPGYFDEDDE
jgi:hypothetical protein